MALNKITIIGLGYIGLPTAAMFASRKKLVCGVDLNPATVETISKGRIHIVEPELDMIVQATVQQGYLHANVHVEPADAFIIAVPTPFKEELKEGIPQPDLSYIDAAVDAMVGVLKQGDLVILESTSPVGTTDHVSERIAQKRPDLLLPHQAGEDADIHLAYCPERVMPGQIVRELVENDRVIGGLNQKGAELATALYKTFVKGECIQTNARTAEMVKLTENAYRDVNIAFANELSMLCESQHINVWELIALANRHPRVGILKPGPGVGGHCIAVDPWFIVAQNPSAAPLIHQARTVNDAKPEWVLSQVKELIANYLLDHEGKTTKDITLACYGITFKADIDDIRESPALNIAKALTELKLGSVFCVEPNLTQLPEALNAEHVSLEVAKAHANLHLVLVSHSQFKGALTTTPYLLDTVGLT